jgi:hypothetical protein
MLPPSIMSTTRSRRALLAAFLLVVAFLVAGCGGDDGEPADAGIDAAFDAPPVASDLDGLWLMSSLTIPVEGTVVTFVRGGTPQGLRADVLFTASGATTTDLQVRQALLADGLLASEIGSFDIPVVIEPDRWVMTVPDGVLVVTATRTGEHLVLAPHPDDPRTTAENPPREIVLDRATPWTTSSVGEWDLVSITNVDGTITAGACTAVGASTWATMTMDIGFTGRLLFERLMTVHVYADDACTTSTGMQTSTQLGYAEEEGEATLRMWGVEGDEREYLVFSLSLVGDTMTLTRTDCLPQPACESEAPTVVVVQRAP